MNSSRKAHPYMGESSLFINGLESIGVLFILAAMLFLASFSLDAENAFTTPYAIDLFLLDAIVHSKAILYLACSHIFIMTLLYFKMSKGGDTLTSIKIEQSMRLTTNIYLPLYLSLLCISIARYSYIKSGSFHVFASSSLLIGSASFILMGLLNRKIQNSQSDMIRINQEALLGLFYAVGSLFMVTSFVFFSMLVENNYSLIIITLIMAMIVATVFMIGILPYLRRRLSKYLAMVVIIEAGLKCVNLTDDNYSLKRLSNIIKSHKDGCL